MLRLGGSTDGVAVGCGELGEAGLIDRGGCCRVCHSADGFALDGAAALGPCHATLRDGRVAQVCCAARKQLRG